jgi:hypothetical protein
MYRARLDFAVEINDLTDSWEEVERPTEWLRRLEQDQELYEQLVLESGSFTVAAYRVARARCRVASIPMPVPTARELQAAALEVARRAPNTPRPPLVSMMRECEDARLTVIAPIAS